MSTMRVMPLKMWHIVHYLQVTSISDTTCENILSQSQTLCNIFCQTASQDVAAYTPPKIKELIQIPQASALAAVTLKLSDWKGEPQATQNTC